MGFESNDKKINRPPKENSRDAVSAVWANPERSGDAKLQGLPCGSLPVARRVHGGPIDSGFERPRQEATCKKIGEWVRLRVCVRSSRWNRRKEPALRDAPAGV